MPRTRIGISGWRYAPWRGTFYPSKLAQHRELEYASRRLNSIEINGTFYSLQRPNNFAEWYDATPEGFVFAVKGGRFITHMKKLRDVETPLANFFAQGLLGLKEKLGPILWQFPPQFAFDVERFEAFFDLLPRDTEAAADLAGRHDKRLKGRNLSKADKKRQLRYAVEVRHDTFRDPAFVTLLRKHNVALVFAETAGKWPYMEDVTADFIYARLHGDTELYVSGYTDAALDRWARRLAIWQQGGEPSDAIKAMDSPAKPRKTGRDAFVYFDNDVKVRAPFDAAGLARRMGVEWERASDMTKAPDVANMTATPRDRWPMGNVKRIAKRKIRGRRS